MAEMAVEEAKVGSAVLVDSVCQPQIRSLAQAVTVARAVPAVEVDMVLGAMGEPLWLYSPQELSMPTRSCSLTAVRVPQVEVLGSQEMPESPLFLFLRRDFIHPGPILSGGPVTQPVFCLHKPPAIGF